LGSAVGSAAGGFLFDSPFPGASFILMTAVTAIGIAVSLGLSRDLGARREGQKNQQTSSTTTNTREAI
jgi:predicted MFS family arabinose efflux permease